MSHHALFIANNDYADQSLRRLDGAERDAQELYGLFKRELGYRAEVLHAPSPDQVQAAVLALGRRVNAGDTVLFYFAGHGAERNDGQDQYLLLKQAQLRQLRGGYAAPAGVVSVNDLLRETDDWPCVARVFIFDACRVPLDATRSAAGAATAGATPIFGSERLLNELASARGAVHRFGRRKPENAAGAAAAAQPPPDDGPRALPPVFIKACLSKQEAREIPGLQRGIFSMALDEALQDARQLGHAVLTEAGLLGQVAQRMRSTAQHYGLPADQTPWMNDGAPEVLLFRPARAIPEPPTASPRPPTPPPAPVPVSASASAPVSVSTPASVTVTVPAPPPPRAAWWHTVPGLAMGGLGALVLVSMSVLLLKGLGLFGKREMPASPPVAVSSQQADAASPSPRLPAAPAPAVAHRQPAPPPAGRSPAADSRQPQRPQTSQRDAAANTRPATAANAASRYINLASLPAEKTAVMAAQGSPDLVAIARRHLPHSQLKVFLPSFYSDGSFDRVMAGDGQPIARLNVEDRVTVFRLIQVDEPRWSEPGFQNHGAIETTSTLLYREIDPTTGGALRSARVEQRGGGFSREKALRDLQRDLEEKAVQLN